MGGRDHECGLAVDDIDYRRRILRIPVSDHTVYIDIRSQQIDFFRRIGAKSSLIRNNRFGDIVGVFYGPDSGTGYVKETVVFHELNSAPCRFFHGKRYDGCAIDWSVVVPKGSVGLSGSYLFRSCSIYVQRFFLGGCDHECGFAVDNIDYRRRILRIPVSNHAVYIDIRSQQIDFFRYIGTLYVIC